MSKSLALVWTVVAIQAICGAYFLWEILASILGLPGLPLRWEQRELIELGASLGLVLGAILGARMAYRASRESHRAERARRLTSGQFAEVVETHFSDLGLTPAETEIAWFLLKGLSISEIADIRERSEGTVKAQCTAIYRKAGVNGKSQFFSAIVEDVLL
ncbi:MAG: helix-turn-helix transcriptional regulator [Paracoccaceae bacterium]